MNPAKKLIALKGCCNFVFLSSYNAYIWQLIFGIKDIFGIILEIKGNLTVVLIIIMMY